jgi:hypothetical protein
VNLGGGERERGKEGEKEGDRERLNWKKDNKEKKR